MPSYVLVTAAYNERKIIEQVIRSVIAQTVQPYKWIIVSDGSTDGTDEIVQRYAVRHRFIELCRISEEHPRNFAAQVHAINRGLSLLSRSEYDFAGNMDADISLEPDYFEQLLSKFQSDPKLGLAGGTIYERSGSNGEFKERRGNSITSVAHACQLFRRECFEQIGSAYRPLPYGGPDTYAEILSRMNGWHVTSFKDLKVFHHRPTASVGGVLRGKFRQGKMDYSLGTLPLFEVFKLLRRTVMEPVFVGSVVRFAGFLDSYRLRENRAVPDDFVFYFRQEQKRRLTKIFRTH